MERDIDLIRQLLLDVEHAGVATPVDHLRREFRCDDDQRILYHVRLLIDAGFLKEAGQTSAGAPCVRLTHEGSEFVELTSQRATLARSKGSRPRSYGWSSDHRAEIAVGEVGLAIGCAE